VRTFSSGLLLALAALVFAACSGNAGSDADGLSALPSSSATPSPMPSATPSPRPGTIAISPQALQFLGTGNSQAQNVQASESGYSGLFYVNAGNCTGVASVSPATPNAVFTVTPLAAGSCYALISDSAHNVAILTINVATTSIGGQ
jgi:hypothetical protein